MANEDKCLELPRTDAATDYFVKDQFKEAVEDADNIIGDQVVLANFVLHILYNNMWI